MKRNNFMHYNMAVVGGVFGGFAVCNLGEVFGNAQTLNLMGVVRSLIYGEPVVLLLRLCAALLYFMGFALAAMLPKLLKSKTELISFIIDAAAFVTLLLLPSGLNPLISLYPIFFATAFQWTAFEYIDGYNCSTIFSSNNYRQFLTSLVEYAADRDKSRLNKTRVFGLTLLYFHIGVALACVGSLFFGRLSAVIGLLALIPAVVYKYINVLRRFFSRAH